AHYAPAASRRGFRLSTRDISVAGILGALAAALGYTPLGFIAFPTPAGSATTMHIPVIVAGVLAGPVVGAFVGAVFGVISLVRAGVAVARGRGRRGRPGLLAPVGRQRGTRRGRSRRNPNEHGWGADADGAVRVHSRRCRIRHWCHTRIAGGSVGRGDYCSSVPGSVGGAREKLTNGNAGSRERGNNDIFHSRVPVFPGSRVPGVAYVAGHQHQ